MTKSFYNSIIVGFLLALLIPYEANDYRFWLFVIIGSIINVFLYHTSKDDNN